MVSTLFPSDVLRNITPHNFSPDRLKTRFEVLVCYSSLNLRRSINGRSVLPKYLCLTTYIHEAFKVMLALLEWYGGRKQAVRPVWDCPLTFAVLFQCYLLLLFFIRVINFIEQAGYSIQLPLIQFCQCEI